MGVITIDDYDFAFLLFENDVDLDLGNLNINLFFLLNFLLNILQLLKLCCYLQRIVFANVIQKIAIRKKDGNIIK